MTLEADETLARTRIGALRRGAAEEVCDAASLRSHRAAMLVLAGRSQPSASSIW
jgi:hypothetical protein